MTSSKPGPSDTKSKLSSSGAPPTSQPTPPWINEGRHVWSRSDVDSELPHWAAVTVMETTAPIFPLPFKTHWINMVAGKAISAIHSVWTFVLDFRQLLCGCLISICSSRFASNHVQNAYWSVSFSHPFPPKSNKSFHMTRSNTFQHLIERLKIRKYLGGGKRLDSPAAFCF